MKSTVHIRCVEKVKASAVVGLLLLLMPITGFAQTTPSDTGVDAFVDDAASKKSDVTNNANVSAPYKLEQLVGDDVVGDFVVGPGKVELELLPGESKTVELLVTNRMGETKTFKFEIEDTEGSYDPQQPVVLLGDDRGPYTLKDYIKISTTELELKHMQRARIPVTVTLPPDAEPGGRYGSVLVSTVSRDANLDQTNGAQPSSAIISRVGTLFFITTPGSTDIKGEMTSFTTLPDKSIFLGGPINFGIVFENTGSVHLRPYGEMRITNMAGQEVGLVELDSWFALPQSLRTREISWNRELLIGRYTATAFINRGYDGIIDEQSVTFWVLPWKIVVVAFSGLFLTFLLIRFIATHFEFKRK